MRKVHKRKTKPKTISYDERKKRGQIPFKSTVSPELNDQVRMYAATLDLSLKDVLSQALNNWLEHMKPMYEAQNLQRKSS